jgi:hypothetical protein
MERALPALSIKPQGLDFRLFEMVDLDRVSGYAATADFRMTRLRVLNQNLAVAWVIDDDLMAVFLFLRILEEETCASN